MIRFLQTPGPIKKVVLGGMLTVICVAMAITLIPGGLGSDVIGLGTPGQGVVANVAGEPVTALDVQGEVGQMLRSSSRGVANRRPCSCPILPSAQPKT